MPTRTDGPEDSNRDRMLETHMGPRGLSGRDVPSERIWGPLRSRPSESLEVRKLTVRVREAILSRVSQVPGSQLQGTFPAALAHLRHTALTLAGHPLTLGFYDREVNSCLVHAAVLWGCFPSLILTNAAGKKGRA